MTIPDEIKQYGIEMSINHPDKIVVVYYEWDDFEFESILTHRIIDPFDEEHRYYSDEHIESEIACIDIEYGVAVPYYNGRIYC